ncbi:hypothetical protein [Streptomyces sp. TS71-3]|uniref:hypothetical protein n=1 Tax=Streptomyces sp. TS71-3 TaxID=2733862 RepID=UPI001BB32692|nr:hypothetical protein [Streptomyces sp. TS71-3]
MIEFLQPCRQIVIEGTGRPLGEGQVQQACGGLVYDAAQRGRVATEFVVVIELDD